MTTPNPPTGLQELSIDRGVEPTRFPAPSKQAAGSVNGTQTIVSSVYFADKILITISHGGRLSQWVNLA
jgi:proteasome assembly chaperone 3